MDKKTLCSMKEIEAMFSGVLPRCKLKRCDYIVISIIIIVATINVYLFNQL